MANSGDALVNVLANSYADRLTAGHTTADIEDDDLLDSLDAFDDSAYRAARLQQLATQIRDVKSLPPDHGTYLPVTDEKQLLALCTSQPRVLVHFAHKDFKRCEVMHAHLRVLAKKHIHTRFVFVDVLDAPFLVTKLGVQVLPCLIPFLDGIGKERVVGFEGLRGGDDCRTGEVERVLYDSGVIRIRRGDADLARGRGQQQKKSIMGFANGNQEEGDPYDSDD